MALAYFHYHYHKPASRRAALVVVNWPDGQMMHTNSNTNLDFDTNSPLGIYSNTGSWRPKTPLLSLEAALAPLLHTRTHYALVLVAAKVVERVVAALLHHAEELVLVDGVVACGASGDRGGGGGQKEKGRM